MKYYTKLTKIGYVTIVENKKKIVNIILDKIKFEGLYQKTDLIKHAFMELDLYLNKNKNKIELPYSLNGTEFELLVWEELLKIEYGMHKSYKEIAQAIGKPNSVRAVGRACGRNKLAILIPCHRVLCSNGKLSGYAYGEFKKRWLLEVEGASL